MISVTRRISKVQRLKELGRHDVEMQMLRYKKECGEVKIRQATAEELERYRKDKKNGYY